MKVTITESLSPKGQEILKAAQEAVTEELERKKRLGLSVVIWQDGKPVLVDAEAVLKTHSNDQS